MLGALDIGTTALMQPYPATRTEDGRSEPTASTMLDLPIMRVLTHELRSPVQIASRLLNVLSRGYVGPLNEKQADLVDRARRRIQYLGTLIDDLLDLAAGKAAAPTGAEPVPVPLAGCSRKYAYVTRRRPGRGVFLYIGRFRMAPWTHGSTRLNWTG